MTERMAWSGICSREKCRAEIVVAASDETSKKYRGYVSDGPGEWEGFTSCPVCDSYIDWNGSDPLPLTIR